MNTNEQFSFSRDHEEILRALKDSKENGTVLALAVPSVSPGIFITAIDDLVHTGDQVVIQLKKHDVTGFMFERTALALHEIESVCPMNSRWENSFAEDIA